MVIGTAKACSQFPDAIAKLEARWRLKGRLRGDYVRLDMTHVHDAVAGHAVVQLLVEQLERAGDALSALSGQPSLRERPGQSGRNGPPGPWL